MNPLRTLLQTIKAKFTPYVTKLKLYTKPSFLLTRATELLRTFFTKTLNIRPRHKDDYFSVGRWLVSRRLAFAAVIVIGVLSIAFLVSSWSGLFPGRQNDGIKTYSYNNILLKFAKGTVRIKGKSGYLAYEGEVSKGSCNGQGTLMNPAGFVVYQGNFANSMYENVGTQYYQDGTLYYQGTFHENLHSGTGKIYRTNGSLEYEGEFALNMKEGEGILYDMGHNPVFRGMFSFDDIKYSDLIGKSASDVAAAYNAETSVYEADSERVRYMPDINAMSVEYLDENSVDAEANVETVYVLKDSFPTAAGRVSTFSELVNYLGEPIYVGTSFATVPELLAVNKLNEKSKGVVINGPADITISSVFTEYNEIKEYDRNYKVYLHTYHKDGLIYVFVTDPGVDTFSFYYIMTEDLSDIE